MPGVVATGISITTSGPSAIGSVLAAAGFGVDLLGNVSIVQLNTTAAFGSFLVSKFNIDGRPLGSQQLNTGPLPAADAIAVASDGSLIVSAVDWQFLVANAATAVGGTIDRIAPDGFRILQVDKLSAAYMVLGGDGLPLFVEPNTNAIMRLTAEAAPVVLVPNAFTFPGAPFYQAITPRYLAGDAKGRVYYVDGAAIKRYDSGLLTVLAGSVTVSGTADGVGEAARFKTPTHLVVDSTGVVYVADENVIRRIAADGTVTTVAGQRTGVNLQAGPLPGSLGQVGRLAMATDNVLHFVAGGALARIRFR